MENLHNPMQDNASGDATNDVTMSAVSDAKKEKYQRLFKTGLIWLAIGVFLMGSSFVITFALFQSEKSFSTLMYIMTTLGLGCILKGLANVLGF